MFEFGEDLLDGVEVGAVGRQKEHVSSCGPDCGSGRFAFVATQVVEHDDVALAEVRGQHLLDIGREEFAVDWAVDHPWRVNAIMAKRGDEGQGLPISVRNVRRQASAPGPPTAQRLHVGLDPGFIDENEALRIDARLSRFPASALARDVWTCLLRGDDRFF